MYCTYCLRLLVFTLVSFKCCHCVVVSSIPHAVKILYLYFHSMTVCLTQNWVGIQSATKPYQSMFFFKKLKLTFSSYSTLLCQKTFPNKAKKCNMCACVHACVCVCARMCVYACLYVYTCVWVCVHVSLYVCVQVCVCVSGWWGGGRQTDRQTDSVKRPPQAQKNQGKHRVWFSSTFFFFLNTGGTQCSNPRPYIESLQSTHHQLYLYHTIFALACDCLCTIDDVQDNKWAWDFDQLMARNKIKFSEYSAPGFTSFHTLKTVCLRHILTSLMPVLT